MKPQRSINRNGNENDTLQMLQNHALILNGNVSFGQTTTNNEQGQNINGWKATGTTPGSANTEFAVPHGLGRIPIGFLTLALGANATIYKSTTAWTASNIYLKCSGSAVSYTIFVI